MTARPGAGIPEPAPHELRRDRLLELLHRHGTRPLILLVAAAGFGKSTLAATYVRHSGAVPIWVGLRAADRDSRRLFTRVAEAVEAAFGDPNAVANLRRGLQGGSEGVGLARHLLNDLVEAPAGYILVLDDFHVVQDAEDVLQSVDALVRGLPEMGQIVLAARETPALALTRLVASDDVFHLGTEDLRFTRDEAGQLRQAIRAIVPAEKDDKAEGWVTGILLGGAPHQLGLSGGQLLGPYVEREVLGRLAPREQRWLETLSVLDQITAAHAERLLGEGRWAPRLRELTERCPFLVAVQQDTYRLHALVRESLLNRLRRAGSSHAVHAWEVARDLAAEALDIPAVVNACQELGEISFAVDVVLRAVKEATQSGRWKTALNALELLPENVRRDNPELSLLEAHTQRYLGKPDEARRSAEAALAHGARAGDVVVQVSGALEVASIARFIGDLTQANDYLTAADHLLRNHPLPDADRRLLEGRMLGLRGVCEAIAGRTSAARESFESAERLLLRLGPSRDLALVQHNLGTHCTLSGDYAGAQVALKNAASHWRLVDDIVMLPTTEMNLGDLQLRLGDIDAAGGSLLRALEDARKAGVVRIEAWTTLSVGQWHRASGRVEEAVSTLNEALTLAEQLGERELLAQGLQIQAEVAVLRGDLKTARQILPRAQAEAQRLHADTQLAAVDRTLGRLYLAEGAGQRAIDHLEQALKRGAPAWGPDEQLQAQYWLARAHLELDHGDEAAQALGNAIDLAIAAGSLALLAAPAAEDVDERLFEHGRDMGLDVAALREIERIASTRRPWTGVTQPPPLKVIKRNELPRLEAFMFGGLRLLRDGVIVENRFDRSRELFCLLLLRPSGMPDADIAEQLWGDMLPQQARHNLQQAVYQLRRWLGKASVRFGGAVYQLNPKLEIMSDVGQFEALLKRALGSQGKVMNEALAEARRRYRGDLLADVAWDWIGPYRLAYRTKFVDATLRQAESLALAPDTRAESNALAEEVIVLEPDNEGAWSRLVHNHLLGQPRNREAVREIVRRYKQTAAHNGFTPNPTLIQLAG